MALREYETTSMPQVCELTPSPEGVVLAVSSLPFLKHIGWLPKVALTSGLPISPVLAPPQEGRYLLNTRGLEPKTSVEVPIPGMCVSQSGSTNPFALVPCTFAWKLGHHCRWPLSEIFFEVRRPTPF